MKTRTKFATKIVIDMETLEIIERVPYDYAGPVALLKASSQETSIQGETANFFKTLTADYNQQFGKQSAIYGQLTSAFSPIVGGGINQKGFSPTEEAAYRTQATEGTAAEYAKAATAAGERMAAQGGGNAYLPSGAASEVQAGIAAQAAGQESSQQLGITEANYAQGRQNFLTAASGLGSVASGINPTSYGSLASSTGGEAFNQANTIAQQNDTFGQVAGILGGVASSFLGGAGFGNITKH